MVRQALKGRHIPWCIAPSGLEILGFIKSGASRPLNYPQVDRYILQSGEKITRRLRETAVFACLT